MALCSNDGVKPASKIDFDKFRKLADNNEGWVKQYGKQGVDVFTKSQEGTAIKMVKIATHFEDISLDVLYDTLHDSEYRRIWDNMMIEEYGLCRLDPNCDVGYYAVKCPRPLRNRDFVFQRYWTKDNNNFMICNHSVQHKNAPIRREYIRASSLMSGYMGKTNGISGCHFIYVTQMDPKGSIPKWMVNKVATKTAPKVIANFADAARNYTKWKSKNNPNYKPWIRTEQNKLPLAKLEDFKSSPMLDENLSRKLDSEAHALAAPDNDNSD
ncbi:START domain-containing protein 10-like [Dendronephthya gigantea]|uniref:START domain-containing protein 10-like n=1 Tax=Dendronephthya gigantea TaxID=151771 RepID=UPI00106CB821|nr:START domain-containing protein 10-like [Dendronephthya gigantea]